MRSNNQTLDLHTTCQLLEQALRNSNTRLSALMHWTSARKIDGAHSPLLHVLNELFKDPELKVLLRIFFTGRQHVEKDVMRCFIGCTLGSMVLEDSDDIVKDVENQIAADETRTGDT